MRILILSWPRCGSSVLGKVLSELLNFELIIDPGHNTELLKDKNNIVCRIIAPATTEDDAIVNYYLDNIEWDKVIILSRNQTASKLSYAHSLYFEEVGMDNPFKRGYRKNKDIKVSDTIEKLYTKMNAYILFVSNTNMNIVEVFYPHLFSSDIENSKEELNRIYNFENLNEDIIEQLNPKYKYTNLEITEKSII
jgi:hypothetical protein